MGQLAARVVHACVLVVGLLIAMILAMLLLISTPPRDLTLIVAGVAWAACSCGWAVVIAAIAALVATNPIALSVVLLLALAGPAEARRHRRCSCVR